MNLELLPIAESIEDNKEYLADLLCRDAAEATVSYYTRIGFQPPWIGYIVKMGDKHVGAAGFKGKPVNGTIEIAYGTFEPFQHQGIATRICAAMVELSRKTDPTIRVTARTLPENNYSTKVLRKNSFHFVSIVNDPEDGDVWEWEFKTTKLD